MSRIANNPVAIPNGVEVFLEGQALRIKGAKGELSGGLNVVTGAMDTTGVSYAMDKYSEGTVKMCKAMKAKGKGVTKLCSEVLQNIPFAMLAVASGGTSAIAEGAAAGAKVAEGAELAEATEAAKAAESVEAVEGAEGAETTKEAEAVEKEVTGHDPANPDSSLHHIKEEGGDVVTKKPTLSESYSKFAKENPRSVAGLKAFAAGMGVDYASDAAIDAYIKHLKNNIKTQSKTETEQKEKLDKLKKIKEDAKSKARLITWFLLFLSVILILGIIYLVKKV